MQKSKSERFRQWAKTKLGERRVLSAEDLHGSELALVQGVLGAVTTARSRFADASFRNWTVEHLRQPLADVLVAPPEAAPPGPHSALWQLAAVERLVLLQSTASSDISAQIQALIGSSEIAPALLAYLKETKHDRIHDLPAMMDLALASGDADFLVRQLTLLGVVVSHRIGRLQLINAGDYEVEPAVAKHWHALADLSDSIAETLALDEPYRSEAVRRNVRKHIAAVTSADISGCAFVDARLVDSAACIGGDSPATRTAIVWFAGQLGHLSLNAAVVLINSKIPLLPGINTEHYLGHPAPDHGTRSDEDFMKVFAMEENTVSSRALGVKEYSASSDGFAVTEWSSHYGNLDATAESLLARKPALSFATPTVLEDWIVEVLSVLDCVQQTPLWSLKHLKIWEQLLEYALGPVKTVAGSSEPSCELDKDIFEWLHGPTPVHDGVRSFVYNALINEILHGLPRFETHSSPFVKHAETKRPAGRIERLKEKLHHKSAADHTLSPVASATSTVASELSVEANLAEYLFRALRQLAASETFCYASEYLASPIKAATIVACQSFLDLMQLMPLTSVGFLQFHHVFLHFLERFRAESFNPHVLNKFSVEEEGLIMRLYNQYNVAQKRDQHRLFVHMIKTSSQHPPCTPDIVQQIVDRMLEAFKSILKAPLQFNEDLLVSPTLASYERLFHESLETLLRIPRVEVAQLNSLVTEATCFVTQWCCQHHQCLTRLVGFVRRKFLDMKTRVADPLRPPLMAFDTSIHGCGLRSKDSQTEVIKLLRRANKLEPPISSSPHKAPDEEECEFIFGDTILGAKGVVNWSGDIRQELPSRMHLLVKGCGSDQDLFLGKLEHLATKVGPEMALLLCDVSIAEAPICLRDLLCRCRTLEHWIKFVNQELSLIVGIRQSLKETLQLTDTNALDQVTQRLITIEAVDRDAIDQWWAQVIVPHIVYFNLATALFELTYVPSVADGPRLNAVLLGLENTVLVFLKEAAPTPALRMFLQEFTRAWAVMVMEKLDMRRAMHQAPLSEADQQLLRDDLRDLQALYRRLNIETTFSVKVGTEHWDGDVIAITEDYLSKCAAGP